MTGWISAKEKMPDKAGNYICVLVDSDGDKYMDFVQYIKDHLYLKDGFYEGFTHEYGWSFLHDEVLYWLEMPELPNGEKLTISGF